jgi:uncharacterized protein YchJ
MKSLERTPKLITSEVRKLCRELDATQEPIYVQVHPEEWCELGKCFQNVGRKIETCGGDVRHGWNIKICANLLLDAQYHAVYTDPQGRLIDITPSQDGEKRILFLRDTTRALPEAALIPPNERRPRNDDPDTMELIALTNEKDSLERGQDADAMRLSQVLERRRQLWRALPYRYAGRNQRCPCGSGKKYKHCCLER